MCNKEALLQDFFIYVPVVERAAAVRRLRPGCNGATADTTLPPDHHNWVKVPLEKGLIVYVRMLHKEKTCMARCG
jgi:hypothetical protein